MLKVLTTLRRRVFFSDVTPLIRLGRAKPLQIEDLPPLPAWLDPQALPCRFASLSLGGPWRFLADVLRACGARMAAVILVVTAVIGTGLAVPLAMRALIRELESLCQGGGSLAAGAGLTLGFCLLLATGTVLLQHYFYGNLALEQLITNGLNRRIFAHALALTRAARSAKPVGDLINHLGADTASIGEIPLVSAEIYYGVTVIAAVTVMAWFAIGPAVFFALGTLLVLSPLCHVLARRFVNCDDEIMRYRDRRVSLMSQVLAGIRVVKYLAWEKQIAGEVAAIRGQELAARRRLALATSASMLLFLGAQTAANVAALVGYVLLGHTLDVATAFALIALFDMWQHPFANLPQYLADLAAAKVGAARVIDFLQQDQRASNPRSTDDGVVPGLCLHEFGATHGPGGGSVLAGWNLSLQAGQSAAIVGPVGSGKSTFLLALLGEVEATGDLRWTELDPDRRPRFAWAPQTPFIVNGSVRANILFGADAAATDLAQTLRTCALTSDVAGMPAGLATEIGERGINLSGGQKQRVALARACARRPTVALLDDPFAAVDPRTEQALVDDLVFGAWAGVTRIVATHRLDHLHRFDTIVFIVAGEIRATGTLPDLLRWSADFRAFYAEHTALAAPGRLAAAGGESEAPAPAPAEPAAGGLVEAEDREHGEVRLAVYLDYVQALGGEPPRRAAVLWGLGLLTVIAGGVPLLQTYWLTRGGGLTPLLCYAAVAVLGVGCTVGRHLVWGLRAIHAGRALHDRALTRTLAAPVRFFDVNPVGRILNRFSFDVDAVERQMATAMEQMVFAFVRAVLVVVVIVALSPWTLVVMVPSAMAFYRLQDSYRRSARETKRLNSITRSPRFAHFRETLEGLESIRAFAQEPAFWAAFYQALRVNQVCFRAMVITNRWFSARLPLLTAGITAASVMAALVAARAGLISPAGGALLLFYNLMFADYLNWFVRAFSEAEARLTSVERLKRYGERAGEPEVRGPAAALPAAWPHGGALALENVRARFAPGLPEVLRGISLTIPAGAKVGVVGRSGAGKTSLVQALYRMLDLDSGVIRLGGVDITTVPLPRLRRALAIIPQSPTLFLGTLRANLDRFGEHSDDTLWGALAKVQLGAFAEALPGGLDAEVREGGANFSEGQRQLFCLARALLSDACVIIMDEATANVDVATDQMIHRAIHTAFAGRTLLIIAHRLGTLRHCDMVVELGHGAVVSVRRPAAEARGAAARERARGGGQAARDAP